VSSDLKESRAHPDEAAQRATGRRAKDRRSG
jgi:hypothetical protein